jgi:iron complex transport system ATP-binding protein
MKPLPDRIKPLLELREVSFRYGGNYVLRSANLAIQTGSCDALIGPNGVGKTTLLRLAAGGLTPSSGEIFLDGQPLAAMSRRERARMVALVPQLLEISFDYTVEQIVEQGRAPYLGLLRGPLREDRIAVDRALDLADVASLRNRIFNELSGGERQRVKIALGLAQEPKLLLLDEPTQNLDIGRQVELIDLLQQLREEGITILASMHDLHLVHDNFARVHLLDPERKLTTGTPDEVLTPDHLTRAFHCPPGRHPLLVSR